MTEQDALAQARALVDELLEAARKGAIIPVRLPGQVEAIKTALAAADQPAASDGEYKNIVASSFASSR